jgi:hypothetical protein
MMNSSVKFLVPRVTVRPFPTFDDEPEELLLPAPLGLLLPLLLHAASSRAMTASVASAAVRVSLR